MKQRLKPGTKLFASALILLFSFLLLPFGAAESPQRKLTLMIYLCGSDLESGYGSATKELQEITEACSGNQQTSVLVLAGGSLSWKERYDPEELYLIEIGGRGRRIIDRFPVESMGNPNTLSRLLQLGPELRPASMYGLILWNHGGGPMEGVCFDELYDRDSLSLQELGEAIQNSSFSGENRLSWIGFDACLMSSVETACACAPYADYMIASQETEPESGWNYSFLREIGTETTAEEIGNQIVAFYGEGKKDSDMLTLALIRLDRISAVEDAADAFFQKAGSQLTKDTFSFLSRSRLRTKGFGRASTGSDYDLADLHHMAEQMASAAPDEAAALQKALEEAVVATAGNQPHAGGLSVYSPYYNRGMFDDKWQRNYMQLDMLPSYHKYLNRYSAFWESAQMADWSHMAGQAFPLAENGTQALKLVLTEEQEDHFATASCLILEDYGSDTNYHNMYVIEDIPLQGHSLETEYAFEALFAVDENGVIQTNPIPFTVRENYYMVYAVLEKISVLESGDRPEHDEGMPVCLQCRKNEETNSLEIVKVFPCDNEDEGQLNFGKQSVALDPEKWPLIRFQGIPRIKTIDETGNLKPFLQWEMDRGLSIVLDARDQNGNLVPFFEWHGQSNVDASLPTGLRYQDEADNSRPWTLRFLPRNSSGKNLQAQFVIRDTQGNSWGSDLIPLDSPDIISTALLACEETIFTDYTIQPFEAKAIMNDEFQGICLRVYVENHSENETVGLVHACPIVNGLSLPGNIEMTSCQIAPGEKRIADLLIPLSNSALRDNPVVKNISIFPAILKYGSQSENWMEEQFMNRICMETELDISSFIFQKEETAIASCTQEGICFQLVSLQEAEKTLLRGQMRLKNENATGKRIGFAYFQGDDQPVFIANDLVLRNCLSAPMLIDLLPGGECTFDFTVQAQETRMLTVAAEASDASQQKLVQVAACGFFPCISSQIDKMEENSTPGDPVLFQLSRPVFLKKPCTLVYSIEAVPKESAGKKQAEPEQTAEPLQESGKEDSQGSQQPSDPYPFFRESVVLPMNPEQYSVTLICPVSPEERDTITKVSVLLVFPRYFLEEIYDLQAIIYNVPRLEGDTVAMDFCGLLPSLEYASQFLPCTLEEGKTGVDIELLCEILIAGIRDVPREDRHQAVSRAHMTIDWQQGTAVFTDYQVERFRPSVELEETVVFYHYPITFVTLDNGRIEISSVEDSDERKPEGHRFNGAPNFWMRPVQELKPDVIFRIGHQDGSFSLRTLTWDEAAIYKEEIGTNQ